MGCCGDEEEDNLLHQPLISSPSPENLKTTAKTIVESTISPMNSHFSALICRDILRIIFQKLPIADIARAACVCRTWSSVVSDRDIQTASFKAPWKLKEIVGDPISGSFWRDNSLSKFAITHRIRSGDSVASLAVKYSVQVMDIKRLNNMMSDHGIHSRERLLIPLSNPDILINSICYIELDVYANREAAVLYLEGGPPENKFSCSTSRATSELAKKRVIESVRRSLLVDDEIARYYLSITDGDPRSALSEFSEDLSWERQTGLAWRTFKQKASHC